ncbi:growth arrest and DNA-damage-inducible, gamma a isoform X1 [Osmerus eperlanus]|uniref:growth arrest and DNA-damage-inducible, gamma a isoform X1 n=1 Tax=Osmerus eperlanus TaxID=29151 RepID=UPI002E11BABD
MTLEEIRGHESALDKTDRVQSAGTALEDLLVSAKNQDYLRVQSAGTALEDLLVSAKNQDYLTVGVYESAKIMNVDPDSVAFCVLATDEEYECDIALQIHFTLIQAFCFDNDINVVRVNDIERLADLVGADETGEPKDAHCILVTTPSAETWKDPALDKLSAFCEESRSLCDWVPTITLPAR